MTASIARRCNIRSASSAGVSPMSHPPSTALKLVIGVHLVPRYGGGELAFEVDVGVLGDIEDHLVDVASGVVEPSGVVGTHGVGAVISDAEPFTAQRVERDDGADFLAVDRAFVDVEG